MGDDKIAALIAEAREFAEAARHAATSVLLQQLADALADLTANTENEREALMRWAVNYFGDADESPEDYAEFADAILAAGFRRQGDGDATVEWGVRSEMGSLSIMPEEQARWLVSRYPARTLVSRTVTPWKEESE